MYPTTSQSTGATSQSYTPSITTRRKSTKTQSSSKGHSKHKSDPGECRENLYFYRFDFVQQVLKSFIETNNIYSL